MKESTITVEKLASILSKVKMSFSQIATERFIIQHGIKRVSRGTDRGTSYPYMVSTDSFIAHLKDLGMSQSDIEGLIYGR